MGEMSKKVERALGAMHEVGWTDLQHRRVAKRLDEALMSRARKRRPWILSIAFAATALAVVVGVRTKTHEKRPPRSSSLPPAEPKQPTYSSSHRRRAARSAARQSPRKRDSQMDSSVQLAAGESPSHGARWASKTRVEHLSGKAEFQSRSVPSAPSSRRWVGSKFA